MLKACIFDMDGVIVDSEPAHRKAFLQLMKPFKIKIQVKRWKEEFTGTGSKHIMTVLFKRNNIKEDVDEWVKKRSRQYNKLLEKEGLKRIPGFMRFYRQIKKHKIKHCIASGGHRKNIIKSLKAAGIKNHFKIFSAESIKKRKPDPEIYLKAAKFLKIKPAECVVFEDSAAGIQAAKKAGMKVVAFTTTLPKSKLPKSDLYVKDFRSVSLEKIQKLFVK